MTASTGGSGATDDRWFAEIALDAQPWAMGRVRRGRTHNLTPVRSLRCCGLGCLSELRLDLRTALESAVATLIAGTLARS